MTVLELIDLIRDLATRHPEIKGFYTGLESQHDDSVLQYPAVRVVFPYSIAQNLQTNAMTLSLTVTVMVNESRQPYPDPNVNVNYNTENSLVSENSELYLENDMRDNAARLANHLIAFMQLSEKELKTFSVLRADIRGVERGHVDFLTGVNILFDFYLGNPYICEANEIFENLGGSACDRLLATLSDSAKINCILKSYNFASAAVQNALTTQQKYDIKYWALPQYDFTDSVWLDRLTDTQEDDLSIALLPFINFADPAIQALLTSQQKQDLIEYLFQFLDFSDPATQALVSVQQQEDLSDWLCTVPSATKYSMLFNGTNKYLYVPDTPGINFNSTDAFTMSAWVRSSNYAFGAYKFVLSKRDANYKGFFMAFNSGDLHVYLASSVGSLMIVRTSGVVFTDNTYYHVGYSYSGNLSSTGVIIYVNGVAVSTVLVAGGSINSTLTNAAPMYISGDSFIAGGFDGLIGDIRFWRTALTAGEMLAEYNAKMNGAAVQLANETYEHSAAGSLFGTQWVFPYGLNTQGSYGVNSQLSDRSATIPV